MKRTHTPGPWAINTDGTTAGRNSILIQSVAGTPVAEARKQYLPSGTARQIDDLRMQAANACLIAAAPEMLEMLMCLHDQIKDGDYIPDTVFFCLRELITKAGGATE